MSDPNVEVEEEVNDLPYDPEADPEWDNLSWGKDNADGEDEGEPEGESEEADQHEADEAEKQTETETTEGAEADDADQWIELKYMDEAPRKVGKEEAKTLAQKGLDYDRIRQERDSLKGDLPRYQEMEKFLKEMQGDFDSVEEFMADTRARIKADAEGISYEDALAQVNATHKPVPQQNNNDLNVDAFIKEYPNVKAEDIPASVWARVRDTGDLLSAYKEYDFGMKADRIKELEQEIETLKNNIKNQARSTGSSKSSGASSGKSLIASLWEDGD